jgi:PadR family transcriptional regulator, regulatory protein PadR
MYVPRLRFSPLIRLCADRRVRMPPYVDGATLGPVEPPVEELELTPKMAAVIKTFLEDTQRPRYGFELMRLTGQPSGTLYPNLAKFEHAGWLTGGKEDIDPRTEGRPARRFYRITGAGALAARQQLAALSEHYRPPVTRRTLPAFEGGAA